jgi:two-component system, NtrC family, response regulator HydG
MKNILIIDDDKDFRFLLKQQLKDRHFNCFECGTSERAFELLATEQIDLVLCDLNLRKESGKQIVMAMKNDFPSIPVIIITGYSNVRSAVELMQLGAADYLLKPLIPSELAFIINNRISAPRSADVDVSTTILPIASQINGQDRYVFSDADTTKQIMTQIDLVAPTNFSVIIYGESGCGKEAFAQSIHAKSKRSANPFLAIDCGALSSELSASILFGHEKGAFTGADATKEGAFEHAHGGTVFLDEITNLPYEIQVSLLRVMQERKTRRVGGTKDIPIDVRIIVASNIKLWDACQEGKFREDLYHRFNEFTLDIKPLRDRKSDILFYASHFLKQSNSELGKVIFGFTPQAAEALCAYRWPGNVRELRNIIRRSALISESEWIGTECLPDDILTPEHRKDMVTQRASYQPTVPTAETDYQRIIEALRLTYFNKKKASELIGMDTKTMNSKIKAYADERGFEMVF